MCGLTLPGRFLYYASDSGCCLIPVFTLFHPALGPPFPTRVIFRRRLSSNAAHVRLMLSGLMHFFDLHRKFFKKCALDTTFEPWTNTLKSWRGTSWSTGGSGGERLVQHTTTAPEKLAVKKFDPNLFRF